MKLHQANDCASPCQLPTEVLYTACTSITRSNATARPMYPYLPSIYFYLWSSLSIHPTQCTNSRLQLTNAKNIDINKYDADRLASTRSPKDLDTQRRRLHKLIAWTTLIPSLFKEPRTLAKDYRPLC